MISKRIKFIASLIDASDKVLDVGTDHALLPIYLVKNNITKVADGSDISSVVLENAKNNLIKYKMDSIINLFCSDGIKSVDINKYNTLVITGMGFHTIKDILDNGNLDGIKKMIIQSNNNHEEFRKYINSINYKIISDYYIFDKGKWYLVSLISKGKQMLSGIEYVCGLYNINNKEYYKYIIKKYKNILKNVPPMEQDKIKIQIEYFNKYLSKEKTED